MTGGLFIALYDDESLKLYLDKGVYGFLMPPVFTDRPNSRSRHYHILADYACSREGADVFFFLKRKNPLERSILKQRPQVYSE